MHGCFLGYLPKPQLGAYHNPCTWCLRYAAAQALLLFTCMVSLLNELGQLASPPGHYLYKKKVAILKTRGSSSEALAVEPSVRGATALTQQAAHNPKLQRGLHNRT